MHVFFNNGSFLTVKSEGGTECKQTADAVAIAARLSPGDDDWDGQSNASDRKGSPASAS